MVTLALSMPSLTTGIVRLDAFLEKMRTRRRNQRVEAFCTFLNAYKAVITKYPPAVLPDTLTPSFEEQLESLRRLFRKLKGPRTSHFPTAYDMIQSLRITPEDLYGWSWAECETFIAACREDLSHMPLASLRYALQHFDQDDAHATWRASLAEAERLLDDEVWHCLRQWPVIRHIRTNPEVRQQALILLRTETFHRQAGLQNYLSTALPACYAQEVREVVGYLRYDAVVQVISKVT